MRSRTIKPGFFSNEELAEVDPLGRILFEGLWALADREGRLEDRPRRIKTEALPYDDCDVDALLQVLHEKRFVTRYEVDGKRYIQVIAFKNHQNPHRREAPSVIPPVPGTNQSTPQHDEGLTKDCPRAYPGRAFDGTSPADPDPDPDPDPDTPPSPPPKTEKPQKHRHGETGKVLLTDSEYERLCAEWGKECTDSLIEEMDLGIRARGYAYKDHAAALRSWKRKRDERGDNSRPKTERRGGDLGYRIDPRLLGPNPKTV